MDDIPSISSGAVGSRFVSQNELETARAKRDEQWKVPILLVAFEPPPAPNEDVYDGRSLAEASIFYAAKQEQWEERNRLANQFRALEEDEVVFLDSVQQKQLEEERKRKAEESEELKNFREAVAAKDATVGTIPAPSSTSPPVPVTKVTAKTAPKAKAIVAGPKKNALKGVIKKKVPAKRPSTSVPDSSDHAPESSLDDDTDARKDSKRRKLSGTEA
ncbi:hypothetical protein PUNSTDRAFT_59297 [Punctularia strigosozonata HHB-11173 SS5]|uniref:uncharacterized protein n=1 Tax=Punctularia strigosozonata (strain HHB-11173) TaxID=741275 RepID=UPI0004416CEE|nr:uncharacterized protein PUNSTDRAFT_59297 [Punctularia strigosozonata HHB-11173 SS5]EIN14178.1 hypothetical protein PUNSTDRAFT_59297 [Punctularia strigosozonata HHB-11173 SS5]